MFRFKTALAAVGVALAVAILPSYFPTGPSAGLDAGQVLINGHWLLGAGAVFLGGLLTSLTPCVYPLIPITVSVLGARSSEGRARALGLTSIYVLGMGFVFSVLGVVAARTGAAFGSQLGRPAVAVGLAAVMLVLATSMFGAFELNLPPALAQRLNQVGGAGPLGAFLMGTVAGFLAAPCTGPVLAGLLAFVTKTQSTWLGGSLLFVYALGIGVPFFLIGAFALQLPKSGVWMEWVKSALGIALVALGVLYLKGAFPALRDWTEAIADRLGRSPGAGISGVLALAGILLGAVHRSFKAGAREFALKGAGVLLIASALVVRAAAMDAPAQGSLWAAKAATSQHPSSLSWDLRFGQKVATVSAFDDALATAKREHRPVMIDFFADWCAACKELDRETYVAPQVVDEAKRFFTIKVDSTNDLDAITAIQDRFGVQGLPTVAFVGSDGRVLSQPRVTGFLGPEEFVAELRHVP